MDFVYEIDNYLASAYIYYVEKNNGEISFRFFKQIYFDDKNLILNIRSLENKGYKPIEEYIKNKKLILKIKEVK